MKNTHIVKTIFFLVILFLMPVLSGAIEFDLALNINGGYGNTVADENEPELKINFVPRLFTLIGNKSELVISAGFTYDPFSKNTFVPEILHTEFSTRFGNSSLRLGRFNYSDPLAFIADGLFDGVQFFNVSSSGIFSVGVLFSGFIWKDNTIIEMTQGDKNNNNIQFDFDNFFDTYFTSKRLIASIGWDHPSLGEFMHLNTALIAQFDLNGYDNYTEKYDSQYLIMKARIPVNNFTIEFGGSIENVMKKTEGEPEPMELALAAEAGFLWLFPGEFPSRLSFNGKIASGKTEGFCDAFVPVTSKYYGYVLKHKMSGLSVLTLNYSSRLNQFLGMSLNASYFVRNDLGTFNGYPLIAGSDNKGHFLGPEVSGRLIWSPVSDMQFNLGGGAFFPVLGDASPDQEIKWRVDLTAIFAF